MLFWLSLNYILSFLLFSPDFSATLVTPPLTATRMLFSPPLLSQNSPLISITAPVTRYHNWLVDEGIIFTHGSLAYAVPTEELLDSIICKWTNAGDVAKCLTVLTVHMMKWSGLTAWGFSVIFFLGCFLFESVQEQKDHESCGSRVEIMTIIVLRGWRNTSGGMNDFHDPPCVGMNFREEPFTSQGDASFCPGQDSMHPPIADGWSSWNFLPGTGNNEIGVALSSWNKNKFQEVAHNSSRGI